MSEHMAAPVSLFYDAFTIRRDTDAAREAFHATAIVHWQSQTIDIQAYEAVGKTFLEGFADLRFQIEEQFGAGDRVVTRGSWSGTHTGSLMGMPATGRAFRSDSVVIDRVVEGRIVERWEVSDILGLMQQLGLAPTL